MMSCICLKAKSFLERVLRCRHFLPSLYDRLLLGYAILEILDVVVEASGPLQTHEH